MYFQIKALVATTLMVASICAQNAYISLPAPGSNITAGTNFTVQISLPDVLSNWNCFPVSEAMGTVLYAGPFNPQLAPGVYDPLNENFSVHIPVFFPTGQAQLGLAHFDLVGANNFPFLQLVNETVYVV
ncbi:hypothetical protein BD769DRAFT_1387796 [Suillus cothurnatus]|nr:hypothetical protein BD769DRAFT_1387796 [Suillus cothurnatus]